MLDYAIVIGVAIVGMAVVMWLFASTSNVPDAQVKASKVQREIKSSAQNAKKAVANAVSGRGASDNKSGGKSQSPTTKKGKSKKDLEQEKLAEAEIEAILAKEAKAANSGMRSEKLEVTTLEKAREQNRAKKNKGNNAADLDAAAGKLEFTEEQKAKEKAHGFKIVEEKKEPVAKQRVSSPAAEGANDGFKAVRGRRASPKGAMTEREELEQKLTQFFKKNNRRNKDRDYDAPTVGGQDKKKASPKPLDETAGVHLKEKITAAPQNAWQDEREWQ